jgi:CRP-like cAMP-binding protein
MPEAIETIIQRSRLFALLDDAGRAALVRVATEQTYPARTAIVREGEAGDAFYVNVNGTLKVTVNGYARPRNLATLGPGAIFGEIAALTGEPRTATVTTETEAHVLRFDAEPVMEILKDYPRVLEILNRIGLKRSEETLQKVLSDEETMG